MKLIQLQAWSRISSGIRTFLYMYYHEIINWGTVGSSVTRYNEPGRFSCKSDAVWACYSVKFGGVMQSGWRMHYREICSEFNNKDDGVMTTESKAQLLSMHWWNIGRNNRPNRLLRTAFIYLIWNNNITNTQTPTDSSEKVGLEVSTEKTKYMLISPERREQL
jgi:hypothetical protein